MQEAWYSGAFKNIYMYIHVGMAHPLWMLLCTGVRSGGLHIQGLNQGRGTVAYPGGAQGSGAPPPPQKAEEYNK